VRRRTRLKANVSARQESMELRIHCAAVVAFAALTACDRNGSTESTAHATAVARSDGSVTVREATANETSRLSQSMETLRAVDAQYSRPEPPYGSPTQKVIQVSEPGILKLRDGTTVRMDGISCKGQGIEYLRRLLLDQAISVAVIPSTSTAGGDVPADVWIRDESSETSRASYSNVIETTITSAWCAVEPTQTCRHNERYAALARAFQNDAVAR
jgi:hypothetical protein